MVNTRARLRSRLLLPLLQCCFAVAAASHGIAAETAPSVTPLYRFADLEWRLKAATNRKASTGDAADRIRTHEYPVATLEDVARYIVDNTTGTPLFYVGEWKTGPESSARIRFPVPAGFRVGDRVALVPELSWQGQPLRCPSIVVTVEELEKGPGIVLDFPVPRDYREKTVSVGFTGTIISTDTFLHHRTATVPLPGKSYLDFAFGVDEPAWDQGKVEFQVRGCVDANCETLFREVIDPGTAEGRRWHDRRVSLAKLEGRSLSFVFESRLLTDERERFSLPIWANPTVYAPAPREKMPNIVFLSVDTLSAKHLPTYGYEHATAPFVDEVLARGGTVFERAVAAATSTPQSHMTMFTSVQPCEHGVVTGLEVVRPQLLTLAETMRAAGYETGAVTEDGWLGYQHGFGRGFNFYAENKSANVMHPDGFVGATLAKARSWVERNADKPFLLFLHTFQVHGPYTPPEQYRSLFRDRRGKVIDESSPRELRELVAYDQEIRYTDDELRRFFEWMRERGLLENTVILLTSDHGEEFLEHGEMGHGRNLYEEVTRVPLIIWGPGRVPAAKRSARTSGHLDLMPTVLSLAGVQLPTQLRGRDLFSTDDSAGEEPLRFSEARSQVAIGHDFQVRNVPSPSFLLQQGARKIARYREADGFRYEAFDLSTDPGETRNRLSEDAASFEPMKKLLDEYEASCASRLPSGPQQPAADMPLDPERERKLRALGYLQ